MTSSLSIGAGASLLTEALSPLIQDSEESAGGGGPAASWDDGDWCPTRPPVPPHPHGEPALSVFSRLEAMGLQPLAVAADVTGTQVGSEG
jgi:hypothetical protein